MELLLFPFMLCITESAPFQPRRWAYRWRKSCSTRSKGNCVQSGVRCRGGAFVGITSPVKCKNSADSMALSISVTVCHCAGVGRASTKVSNSSASSRSSARTNSGSTQGTAAPASDTFYPVAARMKVLNYVGETYNVEQEDTCFSTVGTVRTKDGREINFNVNVNMSRRCEEYYREELNVAQFALYDPLVINLDTDATELSDQTFYFDLDADGEEEEISMLKGSGYLALDKNGDGIINDGSELFGTGNGDGFADLARYDEDGNGWIDENDSIWSKLKIWCKDENGNDVLYKLSDQGVGAICLKNVSTDFTMQGDRKAQDGTMNANATNAVIRKTGIFLYENGNVGTVQHVDMAAYAAQA